MTVLCFILDTWWNSSIELQAHRQTRPVRVVPFVVEGSLEERLFNLQEAKSALGNGSMRKLNAEERKKARTTALKNLFAYNAEVLEKNWDRIYKDEEEEEADDGGDPTFGGFIVDNDCFD